MKTFHIELPNEAIRTSLVDKINNLTKPKGSLGRLEELALQIGLIQQSLSPVLSKPQNIIFAADHGIVEEGVSLSPKEVTWQQISNFLHGGAGLFCPERWSERQSLFLHVVYCPYWKPWRRCRHPHM